MQTSITVYVTVQRYSNYNYNSYNSLRALLFQNQLLMDKYLFKVNSKYNITTTMDDFQGNKVSSIQPYTKETDKYDTLEGKVGTGSYQ